MVASCSSSGEEKEAYAIKFTETDQIQATIHKTVQPDQLKEDKFKEEVLEHKSDLFTIEGTLPSDSFLNDNIKITELNPNNDAKTVSAKVTVDKANTNGEPIEKTITLTGLGYEEVDLAKKEYTIALKKEGAEEFPLSDQSGNSVETITDSKLMELIVANKDQYLTITGANATDITDEVLTNQILTIESVNKDKTTGKITFTLKVNNPVNGAGEALTKEITFTGFKVETDSTPTEEYTIEFNDKGADSKYELTTVAQKTTEDYPDIQTIKPLVIAEKSVIFKATKGELPSDNAWWENNLVISSPSADPAKGEITVTIQLNKSDSSNESSNIKETDVVLKGFQQKPASPTTGEPTTAVTTEVSTVTLGLNGNVAEINADWVFNNKHIFFTKGFNLIEAADITNITFEGDLTAQNKKANLSFKVAAGKWFQDDQSLGQAEKAFTIKINGLVADATKNTVLKEKFGKTNAWAISGIDPELSTLTIAQAKTELAKKSFIYKYMKHFLTGDFKLITQESDLFKGDITVTEEGGGILKVEFQIPENKTVATNGQPNTAAVPISFKLKEFASN